MSDNIVGSLFVELGWDFAEFDKAWKKKSEELGKFNFGKGIEKSFSGIEEHFTELSGKAGLLGASLSAMGVQGLAAAAAIGLVVEGLNQGREAAEFADKIEDAAKKASVSTDTLQELRFAVHALGGSYEDADTALQAFNRTFGLAQEHYSKRTNKPFEALGLDAAQFKTTQEALDAVINKLGTLDSAAKQAGLADKLGLTTMLPALRAGVERINELRQAAHDLGYVMDSELIEKVGPINKQFEELSAVINVQFKSAFVGLAPVILQLTQLMADLAASTAHFAAQFQKIGDRTTQELVRELADANKQLAKDEARGPIGALQADYQRQRIARISNAIAAKGEDKAPEGPQLGTFKGVALDGGKSTVTAAASAAAIAEASKAELAARMELTQNIAELAALRIQEIEQERLAKNAKAEGDKALSADAKRQVVALNDKAAAEKKQAVQRQALFDAQNQELDQRQAVAGYAQQIAEIDARNAATAADRAQIETKALQDQQALERARLATELEQQVTTHKITEAEAIEQRFAQNAAQQAQLQAKARENQAAISAEAYQKDQDALALQIEILDSAAQAAETEGQRTAIGLKILDLEYRLQKSKLEQVIASQTATAAEKEAAQRQLDALGPIQANKLKAAVGGLITNFERTRSAVEDMGSAIKAHDWARVAEDLQDAMGKARTAFSSAGNAASRVGAVAGVASGIGQAIGGKGGRALSSGANAAEAALILTGGNPVIAGVAALVAGLTEILKSKPSNAGAGLALTPDGFGALSGKSRTADTEKAVQAAGNAILQGEKAIEGFGIKLEATVSGLVLGTRDETQVYLTNGKTLTSAVGDTAAAAETALKGVLESATYTSDAQKKLVDSMLAAGKGFDDITAALGAYQQAQALGQSFTDAILKFTDPHALDEQTLHRSQSDRRDQLAQAHTGGLITDDQFTEFQAKLDQLDQLEEKALNNQGADDAAKAAQTLADATRKLREDLLAATDATAYAAAQQQDVLDALPASLRPLQQALFDLTDAQKHLARTRPARSTAPARRCSRPMTRAPSSCRPRPTSSASSPTRSPSSARAWTPRPWRASIRPSSWPPAAPVSTAPRPWPPAGMRPPWASSPARPPTSSTPRRPPRPARRRSRPTSRACEPRSQPVRPRPAARSRSPPSSCSS
ncbi:MAG: hypothetical protein JF588_11495 [Caulobacterales bacterium]|nr:hypothetical protein [Caulobacterales bacterium]